MDHLGPPQKRGPGVVTRSGGKVQTVRSNFPARLLVGLCPLVVRAAKRTEGPDEPAALVVAFGPCVDAPTPDLGRLRAGDDMVLRDADGPQHVPSLRRASA